MSTETEKPAKQAKSTADSAALRERVALQIYLHKLGGTRRGFDPKIAAAESYLEAKAFCEVTEDVRQFGEEALQQTLPADDGLDFASAPNLPDDHPFNLGSRRFGSAETLAALERLKADPEKYRKACNNIIARN